MRKWYKLFSYLLTFAMLIGLLQPVTAFAKNSDSLQTGNVASIQSVDTTHTVSANKVGPDRSRVYPYQDLEAPATVEGFEYNLKDNVEFLPDSTAYSLEKAPVQQNTNNKSSEKPQNTDYIPGTKLMKFKDDSFLPKRDTIYIDKNLQGSFKTVGDAKESNGNVTTAVVNPSAEEVFDGLYIPKQDISLTKGNITDLADGVELTDESKGIRSFSETTADSYPLPAPDTSKEYHEFTVPEYTIYEYPEKEKKDDKETPKGKEKSEATPTPHPEERDAKDTGRSSLGIKIKVKGGKIRIYEPTMVAELGWDGDFDLGFKSMKVESNVVVEGNITFSKEACMRLYGYGVDFGSGDISAHLGIGIYAVFGINGEITITARVEQAGNINGGVKGNLWAVALGVPAAVPYATYDNERFDVTVKLDAKIHAWAYVGPQVTIDILDFNLLTLQVWVGMEGDALIKAQASTNGEESFLMDLSLDFVVLFKAWIFDYSYEKYLIKYNIYQNSFQYKTGQSVGGDSETEKDISPTIKVDGACAYYNMIWGEVYYTDKLGDINQVINVPVTCKVTKNGATRTYVVNTDENGKFCLEIPDLKPQDQVMISMHYEEVKDGVTYRYNSDLTKMINPTVPFQIDLMEADGFNDEVAGMVSPANPNSYRPNGGTYTGKITVYIVDVDGKTIRTKQVNATDGTFKANFTNSMDLSGGHLVYAALDFEGVTIASDKMEANLDSLKMNIGCMVDGMDAAGVSKAIQENGSRVPTFGIVLNEIKTSGTITNLKKKQALNGNINIIVSNAATYQTWSVPLTVGIPDKSIQSMTLPDISTRFDIGNIEIPVNSVSTFEETLDEDTSFTARLVEDITFKIEYEGMKKQVCFPFAIKDTETITAGESNPINQILNDTVESVVNWPDVMFSIGSSQMRVNGVMQPIDNGANTSVQMINNLPYVPAATVMAVLGGAYSYNSKNAKISMKLGSKSVEAWKGKRSIKVGGINSNISKAPTITSSGVVMIPASLLTDSLGCKVSWDVASGTLSITKPKSKTTTKKTKIETTKKVIKDDKDDMDLGNQDAAVWTGVWDSNYGALILEQDGNEVVGTYGKPDNPGTISGTVEGNKLSGTYTGDLDSGLFEFTVSEDGSFGGYNNDELTEWNGTKISDDFGTKDTAWGGVWYTELGTVVFSQEGSEVEGVYSENLYGINGTVKGAVFKGEITKEDGESTIKLTIDSGKQFFEGAIQKDGDDIYITGTRIR